MAVPEPKPKPLAEHQRKREFKEWTWGLVTIDIASLSDKAERINITLPSRVLRQIDQAAKAGGVEVRLYREEGAGLTSSDLGKCA